MTINKVLFCRCVSVSRWRTRRRRPGFARAPAWPQACRGAWSACGSGRGRGTQPTRAAPGQPPAAAGPQSRRWTRPPAPSLRRHRLEARASTFRFLIKSLILYRRACDPHSSMPANGVNLVRDQRKSRGLQMLCAPALTCLLRVRDKRSGRRNSP